MILYYLPFYYEGVSGFSPLHAGLAVFPETFTVAPAAIVAGLTISTTGTYVWALRAGWDSCVFWRVERRLMHGYYLISSQGSRWVCLSMQEGQSSKPLPIRRILGMQSVCFI
jgi:hypothetical protein